MSMTFERLPSSPIYLQIADFMEEQVARGLWKPNSRLAPTEELAAQFAVSVPTIQRSLARLTERGLLRRTPRLGTFVNGTVGNQTIGVVFGFNPFTGDSHYYRLLYEELNRQAPQLGLVCRSYVDLEADFYRQIRELESDIRERGMHCLVALCRSDALNRWLGGQQLAPWISGSKADGLRDEGVETRQEQAVLQALDYCHARGYRQIGILAGGAGPTVNRVTQRTYDAWVAMHGLERHWWVCDPTPRAGYEATKAWLGGPGPRPEVIFSIHDIVTRGALMAMVELGLSIPRDIGLITHANRGDTYPSPVELTRIEVDPAAVARSLLECVRQRSHRQRVGLIEMEDTIEPVLIPGVSCGEQPQTTHPSQGA